MVKYRGVVIFLSLFVFFALLPLFNGLYYGKSLAPLPEYYQSNMFGIVDLPVFWFFLLKILFNYKKMTRFAVWGCTAFLLFICLFFITRPA